MIAATAGTLHNSDTDDHDENDVEGAAEGVSIDAPIGASTKCHSTPYTAWRITNHITRS